MKNKKYKKQAKFSKYFYGLQILKKFWDQYVNPQMPKS